MEVPGPSRQDSTSDESLRCFREIMDAVRKLADADWKALNEGVPIQFSRLQFAALCTDIVRSVSGCLLIDSLLLSAMERIGMEEVLLVAESLKRELGDATTSTSTSPAQTSTEDPADRIDNTASEVFSKMSAAMKEAIRRVASDKKGKKASSGQEVRTKTVAWETQSSLSNSLPEGGGQSKALTDSMLVDVDRASSSDVGKGVFTNPKKKVTRFFRASKKTSPDKDTKQTRSPKPSNQGALGAKEESSAQAIRQVASDKKGKKASSGQEVRTKTVAWETQSSLSDSLPEGGGQSRAVTDSMLSNVDRASSSDVRERSSANVFKTIKKKVTRFFKVSKKTSPDTDTKPNPPSSTEMADLSNQGTLGAKEESSPQSSSSPESAPTTIKEADPLEDPVATVQPDVPLEATAPRVVEDTPRPAKPCSSARRFFRRVQKRLRGFVSALRRTDSPKKETASGPRVHRSRSDSILDTAWVRNVEQEDSLPGLSPLLMMFVEESIGRLLVDLLRHHSLPLGRPDLPNVPEFGSDDIGVYDNFTAAMGGLTQTLAHLVMESFKTSSGEVNLPGVKQVDLRAVSTKPGRSPTPACSALVREPVGSSPAQVSDTCIPGEVPGPVEKTSRAHKFILNLKRSDKVHRVCLESVNHLRSSSGDLQEGSLGTPEVSESCSKKLRRRLRGMFSALSKAVPNPFKHRPTPAE